MTTSSSSTTEPVAMLASLPDFDPDAFEQAPVSKLAVVTQLPNDVLEYLMDVIATSSEQSPEYSRRDLYHLALAARELFAPAIRAAIRHAWHISWQPRDHAKSIDHDASAPVSVPVKCSSKFGDVGCLPAFDHGLGALTQSRHYLILPPRNAKRRLLAGPNWMIKADRKWTMIWIPFAAIRRYKMKLGVGETRVPDQCIEVAIEQEESESRASVFPAEFWPNSVRRLKVGSQRPVLDFAKAKTSDMFTSVLGHVPLSLSTVELSLGWHMNLDARLKVLRALANVLPVLPSLEALALDGYITMGLDEVMAALPRASSTFRSISVAMTSSTHRDHDAAALWKSWVSMVLAMPRSLSTLLLCLEDMQYPEKNFDVSDGMLLELITALPVVADALKLHLPWWTEEMAQAIPFAPTLRRMSFGHTSSTLAPFPLALVVYRLPKEIITFGIHNCIVGVLDLLTAPDDAFPQLKELVLHNIQAPDESEPDALTDDMNLVELLLAIFASDQLRILDLDGTKAVDEDAGWVDQLPRSVHSLTMRVHKLDNVGLVGALLEQYAGATAGRRVHHRKLRFLDCSWSCSKIREMIKAPGLDVADDQCAETLCLYS